MQAEDVLMHARLVQTEEHMNNVQHSLDTIEQLQRYQIDMIQQQVQYNTAHHYAHNDDVYTWMSMLPKMSEQYSFTVNLIRRVSNVCVDRTRCTVARYARSTAPSQLRSHAHRTAIVANTVLAVGGACTC